MPLSSSSRLTGRDRTVCALAWLGLGWVGLGWVGFCCLFVSEYFILFSPISWGFFFPAAAAVVEWHPFGSIGNDLEVF